MSRRRPPSRAELPASWPFSTRRSNLPVSLYGSSATNAMWAGVFEERRLRFTHSCSSGSLTRRLPPAPPRPRPSRPTPPGTPTTPASATRGMVDERVRSRRARGSPHRARSRRPAGPRGRGSRRRRATPSFVGNQPSTMTSARPRYSPATCSPRTQISPASPVSSGVLSGSRISTSSVGSGISTEPRRRRTAGSPDGERDAMVVGTEHGDGRARLGEAVVVDEIDVRQLCQGSLQHRTGIRPPPYDRCRRWCRCPSRSSRSSTRPSIVGTTIACVTDSSRAVATQSSGEVRQVDDPAPGVHAGDDGGRPGDVAWRDAHQRRFVLAGAHEVDGGDDVGRQVSVAEHGRLRIAGRAAGEQQDVFRGVFNVESASSAATCRACSRNSARGTSSTSVDLADPLRTASSTTTTEGAVRAKIAAKGRPPGGS